MTEDFAELTGFRRDLLVVIAGTEGETGLAIKEELEVYYGEKINHGRLYPNLDELAEDGFLDKYPMDKRSNGYRLTDYGRRLLEARLTWEDERKPGTTTMTELDEDCKDEDKDKGGSGYQQSAEQTNGTEHSLVDSYDSLHDVPADRRFSGEVAVQIEEQYEPDEKKDASMLVRDIAGETATFDVWATHGCEFDWDVGEWYVLSEVRLRQWNKNGETVLNLSSSRDMAVDTLAEAPAEKTTEEKGGQDEKNGEDDPDEPASGEEEDVLGEIVEEFGDEIP